MNTLEKVYSVGINNNKDFDVIITNKEIKIDTLDRKFLKNFINKNLTVNSEKTEEKIQANIDSLKNKEIKIYRGDIKRKTTYIIRKGRGNLSRSFRFNISSRKCL